MIDSPRQRILETASRLYREGGVAGITTDHLARAMGTSKRTIYEHFSSRDEILETIFRARLDRLEADLRAIEASGGTVRQRILRFAEMAALVPQDFPAGFWPELQRVAPAVAHRVRERRNAIAHGALGRMLEAGVHSGDVRSDIPIPLMVSIAETLSEHLLQRDAPVGFSPLAVAQAGIAVLLDGFLHRR